MNISRLLLLIWLPVISCKIYRHDFIHKPSRMVIDRGSIFKIDGSYYSFHEKDKSLSVLFFYRNGMSRLTSFGSNHHDRYNIRGTINDMVIKFQKAGKKQDQYFEDGGYSVSGPSITIQSIRYIPQASWGTVSFNGKIINDTTLLITKFLYHHREISYSDSIVYQFLPTTKPDSLADNRWKSRRWFWRQ